MMRAQVRARASPLDRRRRRHRVADFSAATEATVARAWRRGTCGANAHISAGDSRATSAETTEGVSVLGGGAR